MKLEVALHQTILRENKIRICRNCIEAIRFYHEYHIDFEANAANCDRHNRYRIVIELLKDHHVPANEI